MVAVVKSNKKSVKKRAPVWKRLYAEAVRLRGQSGLNAHRRVVILVRLWGDAEFRIDHNLTNDAAVIVAFDELLQDMCLNFKQARNMLAEFPSPDDWADGNLRAMYVETARRLAEREDVEKTPRTRRSFTLQEYDRLVAENAKLREELAAARKRIEAVETDNSRLRLENANLQGRLQEVTR
jgi:hypothetical protein